MSPKSVRRGDPRIQSCKADMTLKDENGSCFLFQNLKSYVNLAIELCMEAPSELLLTSEGQEISVL
jgi:hypothetical protein